MANTKAFRVNDWWQSKAAMLMGMVYLYMLWFAIPFESFLLLAILSLTTISGFAATGYLLNDFFDRDKDLKAGKRNFLIGKSAIFISSCFIVALLLLFMPWYYLPFNNISVWFIAAQISLFIMYSLPPLRLKERGLAGIVTDALYAHTLPVVLAAYTYSLAANKPLPLLPIAVLIAWQTLSGIRNILLHQYDDLSADAKAGSRNWVAQFPTAVFSTTIKYLIAVETFVSILFFAILAVNNYWFIVCVVLITIWAIGLLLKFSGFDMAALLNSTFKHYPNNVYEKWLPPVILFALSFTKPLFAIVLVVHVLIFNLEFYIESYKYSYPVLRDGWIHQIHIPARRKISVIINYPIYYSFLLFGVDLRKENLSAMAYLKKRRSHK